MITARSNDNNHTVDFEKIRLHVNTNGLQRSMAARLLMQTAKDLALVGANKIKNAALIADDAFNWIMGDNCKRCCEITGINYQNYQATCLDILGEAKDTGHTGLKKLTGTK